MPFLTASGIKKLEAFEANVKAIFEKKYEEKSHSSSPYSKQMAKNALDIIKQIKDKNNLSVTSIKELKKLVTAIEPLVGHIDNKELNAVPTTFNEESFLLATAFRDFLKALDLQADTGQQIQFVFQLKSAFSKSSVKDILDQHVREIEANMRLYRLIVDAEAVDLEARKILEDIQRIKTETYPKTWSGNKEEARKDYVNIVSSLLKRVGENKLFSVGLKQNGIKQYLKQKEPFVIAMDDSLLAEGPANFLYNQIADFEFYFNKRILKDEKPMTLVEEHCQTVYTQEKVDANKAKVLSEYKTMEVQIDAYLNEKRGFFEAAIPKEKRDIMTGLLKHIAEVRESKATDGISRSAFTLYKKLVTAGRENAEFSKRKGISLGKCGRFCLTFQPIMLSLAMDRVVGSDEQYFKIFHPQKEEPAKTFGPGKK